MNKDRCPPIIRNHLNINCSVPGGGKTTALTQNIGIASLEWLVSQNRILVITFSKKMAEKLTQELANKGFPDVGVRTTHSFGLSLITDDLHRYGYSKNPRVLSEAEEGAYIKNAAHSFRKNLSVSNKQLTKMFRQRDRYCTPPSEILGQYTLKKGEAKLIRKFMRHLNRCMKDDNIITYQQMIRKALKMLGSDTEYRKEICGGYDCLFIDEYQDMNPGDQKLGAILTENIGTSMIVGDDMQNIYMFRGTRPGAMKQLIEENPRSVVRGRNTSYRLTHEIAQFVNAVLAHNGIDLVIRAEKHGDKPMIHTAVDRTQMYTQVTETIKKLLANGVKPKDIAVLAPFNFSLSWLTRYLTPIGIPFNMRKKYKDQQDIFNRFTLFLKAVAGTDQETAVSELLINRAGLTKYQATNLSTDLTKNIPMQKLELTGGQRDRVRTVRKAILWARQAPTLHRILSAFNKSMVGSKGRYQQRAVSVITVIDVLISKLFEGLEGGEGVMA